MGRRMKHTDIGDIPADWKLQTFEETFRVLPNNTLSRENLNNKGGAVRNIHYGDILTKFPEVLKCNEEDIPYLNDLSLITANTQLPMTIPSIRLRYLQSFPQADMRRNILPDMLSSLLFLSDSHIVSS